MKRFYENYRLAYYISRKFAFPRDPAVDYDDIAQIALMTLWECCNKFDESKGYQFSTYAGSMMRFHILKYFREHGSSIKTPRYFKDISHAILEYGFSLPLSDDEIEVLLMDEKITPTKLMNYLNFSITSIDKPIDTEDSNLSIGDMVADNYQEPVSDDEIEKIIEIISSKMKPQYQEMIQEWMYSAVYDEHPMTQNELSRKYGLSQAQISRILKSCINTVRLHRDEILNIVDV